MNLSVLYLFSGFKYSITALLYEERKEISFITKRKS